MCTIRWKSPTTLDVISLLPLTEPISLTSSARVGLLAERMEQVIMIDEERSGLAEAMPTI